MIDEEKIEKLKAWMDDARSVVFFGGAGVSTESGVPDFRSKDGLYNQHDIRFDQYPPEYLLSHSCLVHESKVYFEFHRQKMDTRAVQPNAAHKYLAALEKTGKLSAIVTQNIDGLHQKAAVRWCMKSTAVHFETTACIAGRPILRTTFSNRRSRFRTAAAAV